ncbi:MAG TPA: response regulator [Gemmatimonadales bacterium]|nr:response regulator [Gemmatimonadales bacterium]
MSGHRGPTYFGTMGSPELRFSGLQQPLVLVVDDEPLMRRILTLSLQDEYRVMTAADAQEAFEIFSAMRRDIAAVVTDIRLPRIDGLSLAETLRSLGEPPPILFISGYSAPVEVPGPFLAKPFAPEDLLASVRLLIAGYDRLTRA